MAQALPIEPKLINWMAQALPIEPKFVTVIFVKLQQNDSIPNSLSFILQIPLSTIS